jgi:hypothetical protein
MKREALEELNRKANDVDRGFDTERPSGRGFVTVGAILASTWRAVACKEWRKWFRIERAIHVGA